MADFFNYQDNNLFCEEVSLEQIAREVSTPTYVYSTATFKSHYQKILDAFAELDPLICYSVKGCSNINILKLFAEMDSGFDIVSGGELFRVLQAGGQTDRVVYASVGKTDQEIRQAIDAGIAYFNIESEAELQNIINIATEMRKEVRAALRVNPDVDPKTHRHTTTGKKETKFGVDLERAEDVFKKFGRNQFVKLTGIHIHIGSPINSVEPYIEALNKTLAFIDSLRNQGFNIEAIDIGGGFGADYTAGQAPAAADYAAAIVPLLRDKNLHLILEPGRSISGNAGIFITRVLYLKKGGDKTFAIIDGAMNDLIRPALYEAFHFIWPVRVDPEFAIEKKADPVEIAGTQKFDVVGPICETGDYLARDRLLPPLQRDDLLAVFTAGAYGFAMSSQYNSRPRAAEVLVDGDSYKVIRRRETYQDLIDHEKM
ncbi:MAG: diaminopimelate decarboxylase [Sedimentisphaerales bacterium]|nr:diaminopimelate decarboxylase [Sedimentisphaerales bacterium]